LVRLFSYIQNFNLFTIMKKLTLFFVSLIINASVSTGHEGPWTAARPDGHAPISVMGDHMHAMGEWMVSYRYMTMDMKGLLKGADSVSTTSQIGTTMMPGNYDMVPTSMAMDMHMIGTMHAISDKWTLMAMLNYLDNKMGMDMFMTGMGGMRMKMYKETESSGMSDLNLAGLYDLARWDSGRRVHLNIGISVPTGSIDEKQSDGSVLGYGMQLGSGTWDFHPAVTYLAQTKNYSYGAQFGGIIRFGENDQDYTLGNKFEAALWGARKIIDSLSASAKLDYSNQGEVDGAHKGLTTMQKNMSPGNQATSQGRDITTLGLGLNYYFQDGGLKGHRIAAEWETPLDQKVNGVQLELDSTWTLGLQYAW
jgi:hypothetical protein